MNPQHPHQSPEPDLVLEVRGLNKSFGDTAAVRNLDLVVNPGEMLAIVGPDGAGKTTLIRMVCGITKPDAGSIMVLGLDLSHYASEIKPRIGYLSQQFSLYLDLTIDENIEFFAEIHGVKNYQTRRDELLEFTRLTPFRERLAGQLSGGMKQKLALAATLIHTPEIIFLDEPTTGVDPVSRRDFWKILSSLTAQGMTIIMTTPYLDEAERASRVALMDHGSVLIVDTPQALRKQMKGQLFEIVTPDIRKAIELLKDNTHAVQAFGDRLNVMLDADSDEASLQNRLHLGGIHIESLRSVQPSLENVFISLLERTQAEHPGERQAERGTEEEETSRAAKA
ncbi:MAG: ABC transporter ATP-binding protein [Bacteroidota bacterium]|nr:ABC transporter ATP-binding protein [Bacteroidota bacterium]MDP4241971.1 ABC transporter ATP-binding protein [Bacteroidota bacterium]MDP4286874.1 ABC transporter ATP-binding protein [Bacteroidota bacterium]